MPHSHRCRPGPASSWPVVRPEWEDAWVCHSNRASGGSLASRPARSGSTLCARNSLLSTNHNQLRQQLGLGSQAWGQAEHSRLRWWPAAAPPGRPVPQPDLFSQVHDQPRCPSPSFASAAARPWWAPPRSPAPWRGAGASPAVAACWTPPACPPARTGTEGKAETEACRLPRAVPVPAPCPTAQI